MLPVGVGFVPGVTVAVKVTETPGFTGLPEVVRVVVVPAPAVVHVIRA
jgi:hypothetical protein